MKMIFRVIALSSVATAFLAISSPASARNGEPSASEEWVGSRSDDQAILTLRRGEDQTVGDPASAHMNWAVATMMDQLTNPGRDFTAGGAEGNEDQDRNIDRMNDPGPHQDDREQPDNRGDDGSNNDRGGWEDRGRFTDEGHGHNPAPKGPDIRVMPRDDWRAIDVRSAILSSGTGIGG